MATAPPPRFIFRGNAMPFGGRITKINDAAHLETILGPPAAALAVVGGHSRGTGGAAKPHDSFSWGATLADARGELLTNGHYLTTVTSSISTVWARNTPHVFEADILRVTLVSDHVWLKPASIRITETVFGGSLGMRLDGDRVDVDVSSDLNSVPTMDGFEDRYQTDKAFFTRHQNPLKPGTVKFGDPIPKSPGGYAITSIVDRVRWRGKVYEGHILRLTGFGTIYFGEVLMKDDNRRLTMVRLQMGSAVGAEVAYAEADPNGNWGI